MLQDGIELETLQPEEEKTVRRIEKRIKYFLAREDNSQESQELRFRKYASALDC